MAETKRFVESGEDIADLSDMFFVVNDDMSEPDRYLVVRRDADYAAHVVAMFKDFDFAHFCAKQLGKYVEKYKVEDEYSGS